MRFIRKLNLALLLGHLVLKHIGWFTLYIYCILCSWSDHLWCVSYRCTVHFVVWARSPIMYFILSQIPKWAKGGANRFWRGIVITGQRSSQVPGGGGEIFSWYKCWKLSKVWNFYPIMRKSCQFPTPTLAKWKLCVSSPPRGPSSVRNKWSSQLRCRGGDNVLAAWPGSSDTSGECHKLKKSAGELKIWKEHLKKRRTVSRKKINVFKLSRRKS